MTFSEAQYFPRLPSIGDPAITAASSSNSLRRNPHVDHERLANSLTIMGVQRSSPINNGVAPDVDKCYSAISFSL
jgi:hypothetical protein